MIYKDKDAEWDEEDRPANRQGQHCLNCRMFWGDHFGWG
jgi:uncharacterized membrane protein